MTPVERIIALVDQMRDNSQNHRIWQNLPLAQECLRLLRDLDDPEENAQGKASAVDAVCQELPEYDVPRFVLKLRHYEEELLLQAEQEDCADAETLAEVRADIRRLHDYIDTEHVGISEFMQQYGRHLRFDPVERTPIWEEAYYVVEQECDRRLGDVPRGMGFCFPYWSTRRAVLAERGIEWKSPAALNPHVMFD